MNTANVGCDFTKDPMEIDRVNAENSHHLEKLFRKWRDIELILGGQGDNDNEGPLDHDDCNRLMEAQTSLMNSAASIACSTYRDLLFKLAFWRWDAAELDDDKPQRCDAIALSAFRDLAELSGETIVLTDFDKRAHHQKNSQNA